MTNAINFESQAESGGVSGVRRSQEELGGVRRSQEFKKDFKYYFRLIKDFVL